MGTPSGCTVFESIPQVFSDKLYMDPAFDPLALDDAPDIAETSRGPAVHADTVLRTGANARGQLLSPSPSLSVIPDRSRKNRSIDRELCQTDGVAPEGDMRLKVNCAG